MADLAVGTERAPQEVVDVSQALAACVDADRRTAIEAAAALIPVERGTRTGDHRPPAGQIASRDKQPPARLVFDRDHLGGGPEFPRVLDQVPPGLDLAAEVPELLALPKHVDLVNLNQWEFPRHGGSIPANSQESVNAMRPAGPFQVTSGGFELTSDLGVTGVSVVSSARDRAGGEGGKLTVLNGTDSAITVTVDLTCIF